MSLLFYTLKGFHGKELCIFEFCVFFMEKKISVPNYGSSKKLRSDIHKKPLQKTVGRGFHIHQYIKLRKHLTIHTLHAFTKNSDFRECFQDSSNKRLCVLTSNYSSAFSPHCLCRGGRTMTY